MKRRAVLFLEWPVVFGSAKNEMRGIPDVFFYFHRCDGRLNIGPALNMKRICS
jgi:hypothetical protein